MLGSLPRAAPWRTASCRFLRDVVRTVLVAAACVGVLAGGPGDLSGQSDRPEGTGSVTGVVQGTFQGRERPLGYATVRALARGVYRSILADSLGRYALDSLPAGEVQVVALHPGYDSLSVVVSVPPGHAVRLDLALGARPIELARIEVPGDGGIPEGRRGGGWVEVDPRSVPRVEVEALDLAPGVSPEGIAEVVGALPGNDPGSATDVLLLRGSTADLKLVLLDGAPVRTPFHVAGLLRTFEPTLLERADLHVGGAPARYDGGLTHILDLRTRRGRRDRVHASASLDLLAASVAAEGPLGPWAGGLVSLRGLHDAGRLPLGPRPYGYRDALMVLDGELARGHAVRGTAFWNEESVLLDFPVRSADARWSNAAAGVGYSGRVGGTQVDLSLGGGVYEADLPLQPAATDEHPDPLPILASGAEDRLRILAEVGWGEAAERWRAGLSYEEIAGRYRAEAADSVRAISGSTSGVGGFIETSRPLVPGLLARAGLRADRFRDGTVRLAPRAALSWEVGPTALLTLAAGRYHQPTRTPGAEVERTMLDVAQTAITSSELLPVASADHFVLSLDQRFGARVSLGIEGFWKRFDGLGGEGWETVRNSGVDLRVVGSGDRATGWLGYGLSWFWSTLDLSGRPQEFSGRHLLSAGVSGRLVGPLRGEGRLAYGAGLPYTSIPFRSPASVEGQEPSTVTGGGDGGLPRRGAWGPGLEEEFLRLDLELQARFEPEWGGRSWRVAPYLRLLNALDRRDALFYTFQSWRSPSLRPLATRPVLPLLGVAVSF